jgi:hypothetical protein
MSEGIVEGKMNTWLLLIPILITRVWAWGAPGSAQVTADDWTVPADVHRSLVTIKHRRLGTLLEDARLNLRGENGLRPLTNWSVAPSPHQLSIRTASPSTAWTFELQPDTLKISSTSADAVLTATAPAPADRMVARLLDRRGAPVTWVGTDEVANG